MSARREQVTGRAVRADAGRAPGVARRLGGVVGMGALCGCITLSGSGGVSAHGAGPTAVEESARLGFVVPPTRANEAARGGEFGVEAGLGQRLDLAGARTWRIGGYFDARFFPSQWIANDALRSFALVGGSFHVLRVDPYLTQLGLLAHAGVGARWAVGERFATGIILEAQGGAFGSVSGGSSTADPVLPLGLYGGVRARIFFDLITVLSGVSWR